MSSKPAIGTVVIPLDGSRLAEAALTYGQLIAGRTGATLHLVQVIAEESNAALERVAKNYLKHVSANSQMATISEVRAGDPASEILAATAGQANPIIVMSTHGRSGIGRWLIGSVADRVVRGGGAPVLMLRSGVVQPDPETIHAIIVPLDGSALSEQALPVAETIANLFGAKLTLIRIADTTALLRNFAMSYAPLPADIVNQLISDMTNDATQYLESVADRMRESGLVVETTALAGLPTDRLLGQIHQHQASLVVMATHGRGGVRRLVLGSVAERLLLLGQTPIVMVPVLDADR